MSAELQAEIDRLKAEISKLTKDAVTLNEELKDVRHEARDRRHENKTLAGQLAELTTDRDRFKAAAEADPDNLRKTIDELSGKIRETAHREAFTASAKALKVSDPARVADLWRLSGYTPEGDCARPGEAQRDDHDRSQGSILADRPTPAGPGRANDRSGRSRCRDRRQARSPGPGQ